MAINLKRAAPTDLELQKAALQRLADAVQDEAHWQQILDQAAPEQREELERVVGPLLKFKRTKACTTPDCTSGKHGTWQPVLEVATLDGESAWVPIELHLCDDCKEGATTQDFMTDGIWAQIMLTWPEGRFPPMKTRTMLRWSREH